MTLAILVCCLARAKCVFTQRQACRACDGWCSFGREGVHAAEVIGVAGVEKYFDVSCAIRPNGAPSRVVIDLTVQAAAERVLYGGMKLMNAKGAASVLMDVHTGEIISIVACLTLIPTTVPAR